MDESSWDEHAAGWDDNPAVAAYAEAAFADAQRVVGDALTSARVLDFGCGTGQLTQRVAAVAGEVIGVDTSAAMLAVLDAKSLGNVRTVHTRLTAELLAQDARFSAPFDVVLCSSVLGFVPDHPATVAMLASALAPGGWFVQWDWERNDADDEPMGLTLPSIREALLGAGLEILRVDTAFTIEIEGHSMAPLIGAARKPTQSS